MFKKGDTVGGKESGWPSWDASAKSKMPCTAHGIKSKLLESNMRIKDVLVHVEPFE